MLNYLIALTCYLVSIDRTWSIDDNLLILSHSYKPCSALYDISKPTWPIVKIIPVTDTPKAKYLGPGSNLNS